MKSRVRMLMCPPKFYAVEYAINPWMEGNIDRAHRPSASLQWRAIFSELNKLAEVELMEAHPGFPDLVFTANAGVVLGNRVVLSRFLPNERRGEEPIFRQWFHEHGFETIELPDEVPFEGAGDALRDREGPWLWVAYGFRTELDAHPILARLLDIEVCSLRLVDPRFYHLDTCFCPLDDGYLLYYPPAFDERSNRLIEERVPEERRICVDEHDAVRFACNATCIGRKIVLNPISTGLRKKLTCAGFEGVELECDEFMKAGGAVKCLTLRLTEPEPRDARSACTVESRRFTLEGQLLSAGLLDRAVEDAIQGGGSFQVVTFNPGRQRQSPSRAEIQISAPSTELLEGMTRRLIDLGVVISADAEGDALLELVDQSGVAPEAFYSSTIFPTEVRVQGEWVRVEDQRMDAVIVVAREVGGERARVRARCKLFRQLELGEQVVVGNRGIRTTRSTPEGGARTVRDREFSFMGAHVSSERRVELAVERIAWRMREIRERRGRIVLVGGPVVIHTGGADHLGWLIRNGYAQAVLGGNGLAAHDIEQALFGTSLGVDLKRGASVPHGHQHHLRAINTVRRSGSIRQAVQDGIITRGVFHDCVRCGVPFVLAGSIRDDGPLPDTQTDLVKAQDEYARWIRGADMILMLASMLHAIGVGNMTPAGVFLVSVDINPAAVTKLSDRGSLESMGVVTDVGSFLNLLARRLRAFEERTSLESHELAAA